jgi:hypothetical protein
MTEPADKNELIVYENVDTAPFVYFDLSPAHGILGGAIQIELAARILNAVPDGGVEIKFITTGRLRCSPTAAMNLRNAIDATLVGHIGNEPPCAADIANHRGFV